MTLKFILKIVCTKEPLNSEALYSLKDRFLVDNMNFLHTQNLIIRH
jgi:hypothetical protein